MTRRARFAKSTARSPTGWKQSLRNCWPKTQRNVFNRPTEVGELLSQHLAHLQHPTSVPLPRPVIPPVRRTDFQSVHPGAERRFEKPSYEETTAPTRRSVLVSILAPVGPVALVAMVLLGAALAFWRTFDRGTLVIESDDPNVPVLIGKPLRDTPEGGFDMKIVDRVTGSTEVRLRSGAYRLSPDGQYLSAADTAGTLTVWKSENRLPLWSQSVLDPQLLSLGTAVHDVAFTPDSHHILTAADDSNVRLWNVETGREVRRYVGHTGWVSALAVSPDGKQLVTGSIWYPHHHKGKGRDEDIQLRICGGLESAEQVADFTNLAVRIAAAIHNGSHA